MGMTKPNMGTKITTASPRSLSGALFPGTKQRVLGIIYGQPDCSFYANELISLASSPDTRGFSNFVSQAVRPRANPSLSLRFG
ncbi:hypothetical protein BOTU111922_09895 [Bordetella tumulicola]